MQTTHGTNGRNNPSPISAFEWKGSQSLRRVHALHEHCLEVMSQLARSDHERTAIEAVNQLRGNWRALDIAARQRAAQCPVLLLDAKFQDEDWWRWAKDARPRYRRAVSSQPCFTPKQAETLMRETLMLAWSIAGSEPNTATLLLGMTPTVSTIIAEFGPQQVERIATLHSASIRPRWENVPGFWRKLLLAASAGDEDALHDVFLYSLQLLGSELIPILEDSATQR